MNDVVSNDGQTLPAMPAMPPPPPPPSAATSSTNVTLGGGAGIGGGLGYSMLSPGGGGRNGARSTVPNPDAIYPPSTGTFVVVIRNGDK